jgi:thioredoxin-related protein
MLGLPHGKAALARGDYDTIRMTQNSTLFRAARRVPTHWILACLAALLASAPAFAQLTEARDLAADARLTAERRIPLLVLFSEAGCPWCARARKEFLLPMQRNPEYQSKVMMREVGIDNSAALVDFAGKTTTQAEFARSHRVLMVPTVVLLGPRGEALAEPLVGFRTADYYGYFLDQRIDAALAQLRGSR